MSTLVQFHNGRRAILTALYRDVALLRPPYRGNPTVWRLFGGVVDVASNV